MTDAASGWPATGDPRIDSDSGSASQAAPAAVPLTHGHFWPKLVAASLATLYLVGVAIGWATNGVDGYYGITRVDTVPAEPTRLTILEVAAGSAADRAGLRNGDVILSVDDRLGESTDAGSRGRRVSPDAAPNFRTRPLTIPSGDAPLLRRTTGERRAGAQSSIRILRQESAANGVDRAAKDVTLVLDSRLAAPGMVVALLTWNIVGLLTLAVGLVVVQRRPSDISALLLLATGSCFAMALALLSWDNRPFPATVAQALIQATVFLSVLGSASLLHLFLAFPAPHPLLTRLGSLGPVALARFGGATAALYVLPFGLALGLLLGPADVWPWAYLVVIPPVGLALLALARSILYPPSPVARAQLKWIAGPLAVGLSALALGPGVSVATGARTEILSSTVVVAAWGLFPIGVGIAILRYRLFDVDLVFRAAMFYPLLAALLAGGYLAAAQIFGRVAVSFIGPGESDNLVISVVAALIVAAGAHPVYRRLQSGLDRLLYRDRLARQRLLEEAMVLLGQTPEDVATFLTRHVVNRLDLSRAWLVLPSGVIATDESVSSALYRSAEALLARMHDAVRPALLLNQDELAIGGPGALGAEDPPLTTWYAAGVRLLLPLRAMPAAANTVGDELLGLWLVGPRRSGSLLDSEDMKALAQIARQAAVLLDHDRLRRREASEVERNARFRRYFSPQIADLIAGEGEELATHRRELTVLVAELRGFRALSETVEPEELVELLSNYLVAMTEVIFSHGGTLDKYLGDGVMAFFGDPLPQSDHASRAMQAALEMQHRIEKLKQGAASGVASVDMGIGLATGWVTVGSIGSMARQEYTVVGDAVTIAARLAGKAGPGDVLMVEKTRRLLGDDSAIAPRGEVSIEGRRQPVVVFGASTQPAVLADAVGATPPQSEWPDGASHTGVLDDTQTGVELLARTALFASLPPEELQGLANRLLQRRFKKGAIILQAHEPGSGLFLIRSGTVKVTRALMTGDEAVMSILGHGEFFGELTLLNRQSGGSTVAALQDTEIMMLSRDVFFDCLRAYPSAASAAISLLSERVRRLSDQLEEAYSLDLPQRLARRLWVLGNTHGKQTDEGLVIDLQLTQSDLAGMVGASRQRVNRLLAEWQDRQFLKLGPYGKLTLLRPDTFALSPESLDS